jgi:hypothetical protein
MKSLITSLLAAFGLAPARRYRAAIEQAQQARASAQEWKTKATQSISRVRELEEELKRQARIAEKSQAHLAEANARRDRIEDLRARLADTERELLVAREHLMAVEVKLDILEGAANVLDIRTRAAIAKQH